MQKDPQREARICEEIIVDAYDDDEVLMSWYYYFQDELSFPFPALLTSKTTHGESIQTEVIAHSLPELEDCTLEQFWLQVHNPVEERLFYVRLEDLSVSQASEATRQALEDWRYRTKKLH